MADEHYVYNTPRDVMIKYNEEAERKFRPIINRTLDAWRWQENDAIIATFMRSGTHMSWLVTRYILQGSAAPLPAGDTVEASHYCIKSTVADIQKGPMRVINTHYIPADFQNAMFSGSRKFMVILRNPKDVAVSYHILLSFLADYIDSPGPWNQFIDDFLQGEKSFLQLQQIMSKSPDGARGRESSTRPMKAPSIIAYKCVYHINVARHRRAMIGSWFKWVRAWEEFSDRHPEVPVLMLYYEDIVEDWHTAIHKISQFFGTSLSDREVKLITPACTLDAMKERQNVSNAGSSDKQEKMKGFAQLLYRKGKVGDWKNYFTVQQNEKFDAVFKKKMKGSKLRFRFD